MLKRPQRNLASLAVKKKRRMSPYMLIGASIPLVLLLIAGTVFIVPRILATHAAAVNGDCALIVPPNPLSAQGLATPYQLVATDPANGPCHEADPMQAAFVQGAVIDRVTGQISIYNPLVIDQGTQPAVRPVRPQLPAKSVVALWFGSNGNTLTLKDNNGSLTQGRCVNGVNNSIFGQFAYCNAGAFFDYANYEISIGNLKPPALGMAQDGMTCPTVRDFSVIDMDQSDNVTTTYLVTAQGTTAQMTAANAAKLQNAQTQVNGSNNRLLSIALDGTLGCTPWMAPDLADPGKMVPALPLNELQAATQQGDPVAIVPAGDPMALVNDQPDLNKTNAYRRGVDQPGIVELNAADTKTYCSHYANIAPARFMLDAPMTKQHASPDPAAANNLFTFLAQRFVATYDNGLNCMGLLNQPDPIKVTTDANGVAIDATITLPGNQNNNGGNQNNGGNANPTPVPPDQNNNGGNQNNGGTTNPAPTPTPAPNNNGNGGNNNGGTTNPASTPTPAPNPNNNGGGTGNTGQTPNPNAPACLFNGNAVAGCNGTIQINGQDCTLAFDNAANQVVITCPAKKQ